MKLKFLMAVFCLMNFTQNIQATVGMRLSWNIFSRDHRYITKRECFELSAISMIESVMFAVGTYAFSNYVEAVIKRPQLQGAIKYFGYEYAVIMAGLGAWTAWKAKNLRGNEEEIFILKMEA